MKIVGLTSSSGPYIRSRWSAFADNYPNHNVYLIEFGKVSKTYAWKPLDEQVPYKRVVLSDQPSQYKSLSQVTKLILLLFRALKQINPDVIVLNGYQQPATLAALFWSKLHGKATVLLSETKEDDFPRVWWRETIKRWLRGKYKSALVGGKPHKSYLVKLGMTPDAIFLGYDVVGNDDFHPNKIKSLPSPINRPYFLAINRFITKKNLSFLISAYANYHQLTGENAWDLVICGDGELRSQIEEQLDALNLRESVHLPGFLQQDEILPYLAHAKCFIHASIQEQWGLVVNEAMAAGLPVLISNRCGCFSDLVIEGVNGFGFDPRESQQLTNLMLKMNSQEINVEALGQASLAHIQKYSPNDFAQNLQKAVEYAVNF